MSVFIRRKKSSGDVEVPEMSHHPDPEGSKFAKYVQYVPIIGMLYDMGATPPTPTQIDRALQMMILVAALMMTTVASCAASTSFDEIQTAAIRFNSPDTSWHWCAQVNVSALAEPEQQYCQRVLAVKDVSRCDNVNIDDLEKELLNGVTNTVTNGYLLRTKIGKKCYGWSLNDMRVGDARLGGIAYLVQCTNMLACSVIINFLVYLSLAISSYKDGSGKYSGDMMWGWWKVMAFPIAVSAALLIFGIVKFFQFYWIMLVIKFPNLYDELFMAVGYDDDALNAYNHTTDYSLWGVYGIAAWAGGGTIMFITIATVLKNRSFVRASNAAEERLTQADPNTVQLLEKAGCGEYCLGLTDQKLTAARLVAFKDQPALLRVALKEAGVKCVGDQLAIISAIVDVGGGIGFP